ncbi:DUF2061 domain-containing protein [Aurantivibrio plasticivorans]
MNQSKTNGVKKTISFAVIHMAVAFTVGLIMTGDVMVGGALALVEPMCNTVAYYFHEKAWSLKGWTLQSAKETRLCAH